jgi:hypothetical protein
VVFIKNLLAFFFHHISPVCIKFLAIYTIFASGAPLPPHSSAPSLTLPLSSSRR